MESNAPAGEAVIPYGRVFESLCSVTGDVTPITSPDTLLLLADNAVGVIRPTPCSS